MYGKPMRLPEEAKKRLDRIHLLRTVLNQPKRTYTADVGEAVLQWADKVQPQLEAELEQTEREGRTNGD